MPHSAALPGAVMPKLRRIYPTMIDMRCLGDTAMLRSIPVDLPFQGEGRSSAASFSTESFRKGISCYGSYLDMEEKFRPCVEI